MADQVQTAPQNLINECPGKNLSANSNAPDEFKREFGELIEKEELIPDELIKKSYLQRR